MAECKAYADDFSCSFGDPARFLDFLGERKENSQWLTAPSRALQFQSVAKGSPMSDLYLKYYDANGQGAILADTIENTGIMLNVNGKDYPVRSCAIKTILERARISGHALNKVSKDVFSQILNYCMGVAAGNSLIKVADEKISAVHGGDPKDYAILEMLPLFERVKDFLDEEFPGNRFLAASYDHVLTSAIWTLDGQANDLLATYRSEIAAKHLPITASVRPGLRFATSDVGMSGANLYPILLYGSANRIIPLGYAIKTEHKCGANLEYFDEQLKLLYAKFREAVEKQTQLVGIELSYPYNAMLGVLRRIGAPKKASFEAADMLEAQCGGTGCTAYEVYLAMSEVIYSLQCEGASGNRISQLEEVIARALHVNWHEYDRPGAVKW